MREIVALAVSVVMSLFMAQTSLAQSDPAPSDKPSQTCQNYLGHFGPYLDVILTNNNPDEQFKVAYQSALQLNIVAAACPHAAEAQAYRDEIGPSMQSLKSELATNTTEKCKAVYSDLVNQLRDLAPQVTNAPDRLKISLSGLRPISALAIESCPDELQQPLAQLSNEFDRFEEGARVWPACKASRIALQQTISGVTESLNSIDTDFDALSEETFRPAKGAFRQACGFDGNWLQDQQKAISNVEAMIAARTDDAREACRVGMIGVEERVEAIAARNEAYDILCDDSFELERQTKIDENIIEAVFDNSCRMFPASTRSLSQRLQTQVRLMQELSAEHSVMRYRVDKGEVDDSVCKT